jgi:hypothetical protein
VCSHFVAGGSDHLRLGLSHRTRYIEIEKLREFVACIFIVMKVDDLPRRNGQSNLIARSIDETC